MVTLQPNGDALGLSVGPEKASKASKKTGSPQKMSPGMRVVIAAVATAAIASGVINPAVLGSFVQTMTWLK